MLHRKEHLAERIGICAMEDICQSRCQQKDAYAKRIPGLPPVIGRHTNVPDEESECGAVEPGVLCCVHKLQETRDTEPADALNIAKLRTPWSPAKLRPAYASRTTLSAARPMFLIHRPGVTRCFIKRQYPVESSTRPAMAAARHRATTRARRRAPTACARPPSSPVRERRSGCRGPRIGGRGRAG